MKLDIVYRVCDTVEVHPERGPRFIDVSKTELVRRCYLSLANSARNCSADIKVWVLSDRTTKETLDYIKKFSFNLDVTIIELEKPGYNYSALKQFEYCRDKGRELVYSVEDDYLHYLDAIKTLIDGYNDFSARTRSPVCIRPDDDVFTYSSNTAYSQKPYKIFLGSDRHWRTLHTCHNTLFTHVSVFNEYWELFASLAKFFKKTKINEDSSINLLWNDGVTATGPVPMFSPIPTVAHHISQGNEPTFPDYKSLWESLK